MEYLVKYRTPDKEHVTLEISNTKHVLTLDQYIEIIKPCSRVNGGGKEYMECRKNLIIKYVEDINKPVDDSLFKW